MNKICLAVVSLIVTGCSAIYEENFDCPPGRGVPCTSVTDLEAMIIDTKDGPDIFVGRRWEAENYRNNAPERVWVYGDCRYVELPYYSNSQQEAGNATNP